MVKRLEEAFPALVKTGYTISSPRTRDYNCIAWAAGDTERWWWPVQEAEDVYWPSGITPEETISAFREAFILLGYIDCSNEDLERGFEKIALLANDQGRPLHAARQLPDGRWTSKLGEAEDIEHTRHSIKGTLYGSVVRVMKRLRAAS